MTAFLSWAVVGMAEMITGGALADKWNHRSEVRAIYALQWSRIKSVNTLLISKMPTFNAAKFQETYPVYMKHCHHKCDSVSETFVA